jgi:hypothetical protein
MRQLGFLALFATAMLGAPDANSAGEPAWVVIGRGDGFADYVDANSIRIRAGRLTAWTLTSFTTPQQSSEASVQPYLSMTTLNMYNCADYRTAALDIAFYAGESAQGELLKSLSLSPAAVVVKQATPGSLGRSEIEAVCSMWEKGPAGSLSAAVSRTPI